MERLVWVARRRSSQRAERQHYLLRTGLLQPLQRLHRQPLSRASPRRLESELVFVDYSPELVVRHRLSLLELMERVDVGHLDVPILLPALVLRWAVLQE